MRYCKRAARTLAGLVLFLVAGAISVTDSEAANVTYAFAQSSIQFNLTVDGGDFDSDDDHVVSEGPKWEVKVDITEDAGFIDDELTIRGSARHIVPPHGEGPNGKSFTFEFTVDADDYSEGIHVLPATMGAVPHAFHVDDFTAELEITTITSLGFLDDITKYRLTVTGTHRVLFSVGGTLGVLGEGEAPAEAGGGSGGGDYAAPVAAAVAGGVLALAAGGWYVRRRWLR